MSLKTVDEIVDIILSNYEAQVGTNLNRDGATITVGSISPRPGTLAGLQINLTPTEEGQGMATGSSGPSVQPVSYFRVYVTEFTVDFVEISPFTLEDIELHAGAAGLAVKVAYAKLPRYVTPDTDLSATYG